MHGISVFIKVTEKCFQRCCGMPQNSGVLTENMRDLPLTVVIFEVITAEMAFDCSVQCRNLTETLSDVDTVFIQRSLQERYVQFANRCVVFDCKGGSRFRRDVGKPLLHQQTAFVSSVPCRTWHDTAGVPRSVASGTGKATFAGR